MGLWGHSNHPLWPSKRGVEAVGSCPHHHLALAWLGLLLHLPAPGLGWDTGLHWSYGWVPCPRAGALTLSKHCLFQSS